MSWCSGVLPIFERDLYNDRRGKLYHVIKLWTTLTPSRQFFCCFTNHALKKRLITPSRHPLGVLLIWKAFHFFRWFTCYAARFHICQQHSAQLTILNFLMTHFYSQQWYCCDVFLLHQVKWMFFTEVELHRISFQ